MIIIDQKDLDKVFPYHDYNFRVEIMVNEKVTLQRDGFKKGITFANEKIKPLEERIEVYNAGKIL